MKTLNKKVSLLLGLFSLVLISQTTMASICSDPFKGELCMNMRFLRSQVMALGEQRELMQINYPYLFVIGNEIAAVAQSVESNQLLGADHAEGIKAIKDISMNLSLQATIADPIALATANNIQRKCASCHSTSSVVTDNPSWNDIFKNDWDQIVKNCSREGRTPYLCRSMNGMMTAYAGIFAASQLGRKNFDSLKEGTKELVRIANDLKSKGMFHGSEEMMNDVITRTEEVNQLASAGKDEAFDKGMLITQSCMQCHGNNRPMSNNQLSFKHL